MFFSKFTSPSAKIFGLNLYKACSKYAPGSKTDPVKWSHVFFKDTKGQLIKICLKTSSSRAKIFCM